MPDQIFMKEIKISKLFHLLYAALLLAPVFAVGVSCVQTAFTGTGFVAEERDFYTEKNSIAQNFMVDGQWYNLDISRSSENWGYGSFYDSQILLWEETTSTPIYFSNFDTLVLQYLETHSGMTISLENSLPTLSNTFDLGSIYKFAFCPGYWEGDTVITLRIDTSISDIEKVLPVIGNEEGYQDIFYTSVGKVAKSDWFNWAQNSFIGDGFRYMGNIFGMPTDNPFYTFTCYWCAISILWLIFDVVMYVPKLAHRWLDRGAIE